MQFMGKQIEIWSRVGSGPLDNNFFISSLFPGFYSYFFHHDRRILKKQDEIHVSPELRNTIRRISKKEIEPNPNIFDEIQNEVEITIGSKIYPSFLLSPVFIEFTEQTKQQLSPTATENRAGCSSSSTSSSAIINTADGTASFGTVGSAPVNLIPLLCANDLQTLHEDVELKLESSHPLKTNSDRHMPKLTSDLLLATQKRRLDVRPQG